MKQINGITSISNFRELGNIQTKYGKIKPNMIFRSGTLANLSVNDMIKFDQLEIKDIIDFRSFEEAKNAPDYIGNSNYHLTPALSEKIVKSLPDKNVEFFIAKANFFDALKVRKLFARSYSQLPFKNSAYSQVFDELDKGNSILFHCLGGKDRTGIMSMLILLALGVNKKDVYKDYILTNEYKKEENYLSNKEVFNRTKNIFAVHINKTMRVAFRRYFNSTMKAIFSKYSTIEQFLLQEYGVTTQRIEKWREFYLM